MELRLYHAPAALKPPLSSFSFLFLPLPLPFFICGVRGLPSGLCRSSWQAPFEAFHSCSSYQDCALLSWLCSINKSPPASLLTPSSSCSLPLSICSCVREGSVSACVCVCVRKRGRGGDRERRERREAEWVKVEMAML